MCCNQKIIDLIYRNENWLLAKILCYTRTYKQPECSSLINHSWHQTVNDFALILSEFYQDRNYLNNKPIINKIDNTFLRKNALAEVKRCYSRNIEPHVYLSFLKIIKEVYKELISDANFPTNEKLSFYRYLDNCFDCIEIAFIREWSDMYLKTSTRLNKTEELPEQTELIFENLPIPVLLINPLHKVVKNNQAAKQLFPFLFEKENNKSGDSIQIKEKDILIVKIDEFHQSKHEEINFETHLNTFSGDFYGLVCLRKFHSSQNIMVSFIDLTQWKNLEKNLEKSKKKAEESDQMKTAFLANMSHEIRTPLNAIVGFAELLLTSDSNQNDCGKYLDIIKKSSNDLLNIIEDLIDISKIESKQLNINRKRTKLFDIFSDLNLMYSEFLGRNGKADVKIILRVQEDEKDIAIRTDPKRLKQVLSNLIGNAIKFTEKGNIELGYKLAEDKLVYFYVKDSGVGIPYDMQRKIFERFVQVNNTYTKNTNGTGLGLTISKNIIELLGGKIWVTSKPNKGSNFYFYLPYIKATKSAEKGVTSFLKNDSKIELSSHTFLIAEDEDSNFIFLRESLYETGVKIIRARNGLEAINHVESNNDIGLVLMDIKMPEINGFEAIKYIKQIKPELPIVAITAFALDYDKKSCFEAGCNEYLSKPINRKQLLSIIYKLSQEKSTKTIKS